MRIGQKDKGPGTLCRQPPEAKNRRAGPISNIGRCREMSRRSRPVSVL
jgi:hypothetical protein